MYQRPVTWTLLLVRSRRAPRPRSGLCVFPRAGAAACYRFGGKNRSGGLMCLLERSDKKKKSQKTTARRRRRRRVCVWVCMCVSVSVSEIVSSSFLCSSLCICRPRVCGPELGGWVVHWFLFDSLLPDDETSSPKCRNSIRRNVAAFAAEIVPSLSLSLSLGAKVALPPTHRLFLLLCAL